jgi:hypothetical protein
LGAGTGPKNPPFPVSPGSRRSGSHRQGHMPVHGLSRHGSESPGLAGDGSWTASFGLDACLKEPPFHISLLLSDSDRPEPHQRMMRLPPPRSSVELASADCRDWARAGSFPREFGRQRLRERRLNPFRLTLPLVPWCLATCPLAPCHLSPEALPLVPWVSLKTLSLVPYNLVTCPIANPIFGNHSCLFSANFQGF